MLFPSFLTLNMILTLNDSTYNIIRVKVHRIVVWGPEVTDKALLVAK